jgi:hypothetical protein
LRARMAEAASRVSVVWNTLRRVRCGHLRLRRGCEALASAAPKDER